MSYFNQQLNFQLNLTSEFHDIRELLLPYFEKHIQFFVNNATYIELYPRIAELNKSVALPQALSEGIGFNLPFYELTDETYLLFKSRLPQLLLWMAFNDKVTCNEMIQLALKHNFELIQLLNKQQPQ